MEKEQTNQIERNKNRMTEEQQKKLLSLFFILKKTKISFKTTMFFALIKTPASNPQLDKWAFIFRSETKLPFGLGELQTMLDILSTQIEGLPLKIEAKKVVYDKKECFAITFEVLVKL